MCNSIPRVATAALALFLLAPSLAHPQSAEPLTLVGAISAARELNPRIAAAVLATEAAGSRARQAGRWPNPEVSVYQENFPGAIPDTDQWVFSVSQRIRVGGQLGLGRDAETARRAAAKADAVAVQADLVLAIQREYARAHALERRLHAVRTALQGTRELLDDLEARREAGDVSTFDVERLRVESQALRARAAETARILRGAITRIAALTCLEPPSPGWSFPTPAGQLGGPPILGAGNTEEILGLGGDTAGPDGTHVGGATITWPGVARRPDLQADRERVRAAEIDARAVRRAAVPDIVVTAGYTHLDPSLGGLVWGLNVTVPLFDRNHDAAAAADATAASRKRLSDARTREADAQRAEAMEAFAATTETLRLLGPSEASGIVAMARLAYDEGETEVFALLDALSADLDSRLLRIDLEERRAEQWFVWKWTEGNALEEGLR